MCTIFLGKSYAQDTHVRFWEMEKEVDDISYSNKQRAQNLLDEMYKIAGEERNDLLTAHCLQSESLFKLRQGIVDSTLIHRINSGLNNPGISSEEESLLLLSLLRYNQSIGDLSETFDISLRIIEIAGQANDSLLLAKTYNTMGITYANILLNDMADEYFNKALEYITPSAYPDIYYTIKNNLFHNYSFISVDNEISVKDSLYNLVRHAELEKKDHLLFFLYSNLGDYLTSVHDENALYYLNKSLEMCEENPHIQVLTLLNLGDNYKYQGDLKKALFYYKKAESTENNNNHRLLSAMYRNISLIYEEMNNKTEALVYARKAQEASDKMHGNHLLIEAYRKYLRSNVVIAENKLKLAESEISLRKNQSAIILLSSILFAVITLFLLFSIFQIRKNAKQRMILKEAENNELSIRLKLEQELKKSQADQLENKLREITSYSLLLSNKNNVLQNLLSVSDRLSSSDNAVKKEMRKIIKENLHTEEDWKDFMLHFNEVHPRFFDKLKELCPDITQIELKLAAYIRIGLSTNQIALMLNITSNSIWVNRSRLKKKMNLAKDENMDNVIQSL